MSVRTSTPGRSNWLLLLGGGAGCTTFMCRRVRKRSRRIREAKVIQVGYSIVGPCPGRWWERAKRRGFWRLYVCGYPRAKRIGHIPATDVLWARSLSGHSLEQYATRANGRLIVSHWVVVREIRRCEV